MRMLPDNPSVDFLRREAKDLLASLRELDPATSLAQAQRALAEQYGSASWTALRAEVDRRRSSPPEPDAELASALCEAFGLGELQRVRPVAYQHMGRSWSLDTDGGRFHAHPLFSYIGDAQAEVGVALLERSRAHGVLSPRPVRRRDGGLVVRVGDQSWRVDEWLDMGPTPIRPVRSAVAHRAGELLATVHAVGGATEQPIPPYLLSRPRSESWDALTDRARRSDGPWLAALTALRPSIDGLLDVEGDPSSAGPTVLSLCDLVPEAVRYGSGDDLVVVHSAFAGGTVPAWELGYVLIQWALYGQANPGAAQALLAGYRQRAGGLPELDLEAFTLGIGGYLNWTYNAICEALVATGGEETAFAELSVREVLHDPLTVEKLEAFLGSFRALA